MLEPCQVIGVDIDEDGFYRIRFDGSGNTKDDRPEPVECFFPWGTVGRPRPVAGEGVVGPNGVVDRSRPRAWGQVFTDPKIMSALPRMEDGSNVVYGDMGLGDRTNCLWFDGTTGSVQLYAPHKNSDAASSFVINLADPANPAVQILHGDGQGIALMDGGVLIYNANGTAAVQVLKTGSIVLRGTFTLAGGGVFGQPQTGEAVALAQPLIDLMAVVGPVIAALMNAVNALAPGTFTPEQISSVTEAAAKYVFPGAPDTKSSLLKASSDAASGVFTPE